MSEETMSASATADETLQLKPWAGSGLMAEALAAQYPGTGFTCNLETGEITEWRGPGPKPDDAAVEAAINAYRAAYPWPPPRRLTLDEEVASLRARLAALETRQAGSL
jgi:hypothetical protein